MKYIVIEIQKSSDGTIATIVNTYASRDLAEQQYHTILAFAAVSALPMHAATMLTEEGRMVMNQYYIHEIEPTPEPEPEETEEA